MSEHDQQSPRDDAEEARAGSEPIEDLAPDEADQAEVAGGIADGVLNPKAISKPQPAYPPIR
jgi:hypothetical protein